jgi:hypothetical protein
MFRWCADGHGFRWIAQQLTASGTPSPRPGRGWLGSGVRPMLYNVLYRGELLWNRTQKIDRGGRTRSIRRRARSEWLRLEAPELRIISEPLWQAAHAQLLARRQAHTHGVAHPDPRS